MKKTIDEIRHEIDQIDTQLLQLIKDRLQLVHEIGHVKSNLGLPIFDAERESFIIKKHRTKAENLNVSSDLIEDIIRLLIHESYLNQVHAGYKQVNPKIKSIIIIGGKGKMGQLFNRQFQLSGYKVDLIDKDQNLENNQVFEHAGLVLVAVPINKTLDVINSLPPLPKSCVLADITSIKQAPVKAMLKIHNGPVVGLHPMFGPSVKTFANQLIIQCNGRMPKHHQWLIDQISLWGCRVEQITPLGHDKAMGYIQALRHFTSFIFGSFLENEKVDLAQVLKLSSPIYRLELSIVGRLFAQSPELYADIILASEHNLAIIRRYIKMLTSQQSSLRKRSKSEFIEQFNKTANYFGEYSSLFQSETDQLLRKPKL